MYASRASPTCGGPRCARPPQRLCSFSSGLPLFFVPEHGVEDGHDLPSDGDEGHHFRLTLSEQALVESTARKMAERAAGRPPPIMLLPFHLPDLRVNGATPIRLAILRRSRRPSSGTSARTLRAIVLPTPEKVTSRSSFSRQSGEPRTIVSISRSMTGSSFSSAAM